MQPRRQRTRTRDCFGNRTRARVSTFATAGNEYVTHLDRLALGAWLLLFGCVDDRQPSVLGPPAFGNVGVSGTAETRDQAGPGADPGNTSLFPSGAPSAAPSAAPSGAVGAGSGAVTGSILQADSAELSFGDAAVGQSVPGLVLLRNLGDRALEQLGFLVTSQATPAFASALGTCGSQIAAGAVCSVGLSFSPPAVGSYEGALEVSSAGALLLRVPLSGAGLAPGALTSDTAGHDFAGQAVGSSGTSFVWEIRNAGTTATLPLRVLNPNPLDFFTTSDCDAVSLVPGGSCRVTVGFAPRSSGVLRSVISVEAGNQSLTLNVLGRGQQRLTLTTSGGGRIESSVSDNCNTSCDVLADAQTVTLTAQTDNGSDLVFSGWTGADECAGPARSCTLTLDRSRAVQANFQPLTHNLAFMSSESFLPTLGSAGAYDAACNRLASAAGINNVAGDGFVAALSGPDTFWDRMGTSPNGWVRMDGLPIGDRTGLLAQPPLVHYSVRYDEYGRIDADRGVWSGTSETNQVDVNCNGWTTTSETVFVEVGDGHRARQWLASGVTACSYSDLPETTRAVLCLGTTQSAPIDVPPFTGKRIWVTNTPYLVGSQTPDQKCQAERPAGVQQARALIAYAGRHAAELLEPGTTYVSPDAHLVGTGSEIAARAMPGGISLTASGEPVDVLQFTWTGEPFNPSALPSASDTCNDWTSPAGTCATGIASYDNRPAFAYGSSLPCDAQDHRLYCFEL